MLLMMRCRVSVTIPLMVFLTSVGAASSQQTRSWSCLTERQLSAASSGRGRRYLAAQLMSGGSGGRCAAWLPRATDGTVADSADVIGVPEGLRGDWAVVPLPLRTWGYSSTDPIAQVIIARDAAGILRAQSAVPRQLGGTSATAENDAPVHHPDEVFDFSRGVIGPAGNKFGTFAGRGAAVALDRRADGGHRNLAITFSGSAKGYGGLWVELASHRRLANPDWGLDASAMPIVVIRGRGRATGAVLVSDVAAAKHDAPLAISSLASAVPASDGSWEWKASMPDAIDRKHVRTLTIDLTGTGDGSIEISGVWLIAPGDSIASRGRESASSAAVSQRGLWAWNTDEILESEAAQKNLRDAIRTWGITDVFLQLPYRMPSMGSWAIGPSAKRLAVLVARLHQDGLIVHALDGAPFLAVAEAKSLVESQARRVVRFNHSWGPDGAFDALHLDIEPYTLPAFGGLRRDELLRSYVNVLAAARRAIFPLPLWLDIPFWYDETDEVAVCDCSFRSGLLERLVQLADGIAVMAYRTAPDGANGIAAQAFGEISMARKANRKILLGLETVPLAPEDQWHVVLKEAAVEKGSPGALLDLVAGSAPHLLFSSAVSAEDLAWVKEHAADYRLLAVTLVRGPDPSAVTFHGETRNRIETAANAAIALLQAGGVPPDGLAFHELRTLPVP